MRKGGKKSWSSSGDRYEEAGREGRGERRREGTRERRVMATVPRGRHIS